MAFDPENKLRRNIKLQAEYARLQNIKVKGTNITKLSHEAIMYDLRQKFYLSEITIAKILKLDLNSDISANQLELFD